MAQSPEIETLKNKLRLERGKLLDAVQAFSEQELLHASPAQWSIKDILAHVANSEMLNVKFARWMVDVNQPAQLDAVKRDYPDYVGDFTLDSFNAYLHEKFRAHSLDAILQTLNLTRAETLAWVETLTERDLERAGEHAVWGAQTVRGMLKILMLHDKMHTQELVKRKMET